MIYVAAPFTSESPVTQSWRHERTCEFVSRMLSQGFHAFSPVCYCLPIAERNGWPTDAGRWHQFNMDVLRRCEAMYILQLPGWQNSKGVTIEIKTCVILGMAMVHYDEDFKLVDEYLKGAVPEQF